MTLQMKLNEAKNEGKNEERQLQEERLFQRLKAKILTNEVSFKTALDLSGDPESFQNWWNENIDTAPESHS